MKRGPIVSMLTAATAAPFLAPSYVRGQQLATLRLASPPDDDVSAALYGTHAGIFEKHGLDVQIQKFSNGAAVAAAVIGGSIDIGKSSVLALTQAYLRGIPFRLIAGSRLYDSTRPTNAIIVTQTAPFKEAADLNGKSISGPSVLDLNQLAIMAWMDANGGSSGSIKFVELPASSILSALATSRVDAAVANNPALSEALATGTVRVLGRPFTAIAKHFLVAAWYSSRDYATRNGEILNRFRQSLNEATRYANAHPSATAPLISEFSGISVDTIMSMPREVGASDLDPASIQPNIDVAAKYKFINRAFPAADLLG
jgi:NitT/TauT family transport system substrate-binding protein